MSLHIASRQSDIEEQDLLAASPDGSINKRLSRIKSTMDRAENGMIIELPDVYGSPSGESHRIIVVLNEWRPSAGPGRGSWSCVVVASTHPAYQVAGYDIVVADSQVRRGQRIQPNELLKIGVGKL